MRRAGDARRCSCRIVALRAAVGDGKLRRAKKFKMLQRSEPVITCHSGDGLAAAAAVPAMSASFSLLKPGDTNRANDLALHAHWHAAAQRHDLCGDECRTALVYVVFDCNE